MSRAALIKHKISKIIFASLLTLKVAPAPNIEAIISDGAVARPNINIELLAISAFDEKVTAIIIDE